MDLFQVTLITGSAVMLVISGLFLITKTMPSRPGINWWLCASLLSVLILLSELIHDGHSTNKFSAFIFMCGGIAVVQSTIIGTYLFSGLKLNIKKRLNYLFAFVSVISAFIVIDQDMYARITFAAYASYYLTSTAYKIYPKDSQLNFKYTSVFMVLLAIHYLDYPVMSNMEGLIAVGYIIWMTLMTGIFMSLSALALTQFKITTLDSERRAI